LADTVTLSAGANVAISPRRPLINGVFSKNHGWNEYIGLP
jgi:hypothetical protein